MEDHTFKGWSDGSRWNGWDKALFELKAALSVLNTLGATSVRLGDKNVLRANLDSGNGVEEVEWEAEVIELADGGTAVAYSVGSGEYMWEKS